LIEEISPFLIFNMVSDDSDSVYALFEKLSDKLFPHLTTESKHLYPFLYIHQDSEVRLPAIKFYYRHKEIIKNLEEYLMKWPNSASIKNRPFEFIKDCNCFFDTLRLRIEKENTVLFPLIEKDVAR
jgi:hemerythrin-like domain-containing protein